MHPLKVGDDKCRYSSLAFAIAEATIAGYFLDMVTSL